MGAPRKKRDERAVTHVITLYEPFSSGLKKLAKAQDTSVSEIIRACISYSVGELYPEWNAALLVVKMEKFEQERQRAREAKEAKERTK